MHSSGCNHGCRCGHDHRTLHFFVPWDCPGTSCLNMLFDSTFPSRDFTPKARNLFYPSLTFMLMLHSSDWAPQEIHIFKLWFFSKSKSFYRFDMSCFQAFSSLCYILSIFLSPLLDFQVQCIGGPKKHIVFGDSCSAACQAVNDALRHFQVLQASVFVDGFTCFDLFEPLNAFDGNAVFNASIGDLATTWYNLCKNYVCTWGGFWVCISELERQCSLSLFHPHGTIVSIQRALSQMSIMLQAHDSLANEPRRQETLGDASWRWPSMTLHLVLFVSQDYNYIVLVNLKSAHRPQVLSIYELFKFFAYQRIGIVYGYRSINSLAKDLLLEMMANDNAAGTYSWTPLFNHRVEFIADAQAAIDLAASKDSRTVSECLGMHGFAFESMKTSNRFLQAEDLNHSGFLRKSFQFSHAFSLVFSILSFKAGLQD